MSYKVHHFYTDRSISRSFLCFILDVSRLCQVLTSLPSSKVEGWGSSVFLLIIMLRLPTDHGEKPTEHCKIVVWTHGFEPTIDYSKPKLVTLFSRLRERSINTYEETSRPYYSFKIFPLFWLAKSTRIIHHNQLLMTKFGRILCLTRNWRQKCSVLAD